MDVVASVPEPVIDTPVVEDDSIAAHEAQFGKAQPAPVEDTPERPRHRAKSQEATAADVPRIAELTKKLREAERRAEDAERRATTRPQEPERRAEQPTPVAATDKPNWKAFEDQIGTKYDSWSDAQEAWADARDDWKTAQTKKADSERQQSQSQEHAQRAVLDTYVKRAQDYGKSHPGFHDRMKAAESVLDGIPDLLFQSILRLDNGPEIADYLVDHPAELDEMCLLTDGKSVSDSSVALLQRRLSHYRAPAAATGSVATVTPPRMAPRPPNPVRTGPLKTGDDLPGDESSLADHEKAFHKKRR